MADQIGYTSTIPGLLLQAMFQVQVWAEECICMRIEGILSEVLKINTPIFKWNYLRVMKTPKNPLPQFLKLKQLQSWPLYHEVTVTPIPKLSIFGSDFTRRYIHSMKMVHWLQHIVTLVDAHLIEHHIQTIFVGIQVSYAFVCRSSW